MALVLLAGCSSGGRKAITHVSNGTPIANVCGQRFNEGGGGWYLEDASQHDLVVNRMSPGDEVVVQLSHDCKANVDYQIVPPNAANVVHSAPPDKPVFLILSPTAQKFVVNFQRPSGPGTVTVDFTQPTTSLHP